LVAPRIYTPQEIAPAQELQLDASASRHLGGALRLQSGDALILFNGDGHEYPARITRLDRRAVYVLPGTAVHKSVESALAIHLGVGISRGERMDWIVQKSTELGVSEMTPLFSERCEVKLKGERADKKLQHWRQVAISACEQCGRNLLPRIHSPMTLQDWQASVHADLKLVLHHRASAPSTAPIPSSLALLVGPEGGLSASEIALVEAQGFGALALGPRILRTETAPLAAIAIAQAQWGDMGIER
jgi:16S rRNA (uracil1498-N3)-methyltransferase